MSLYYILQDTLNITEQTINFMLILFTISITSAYYPFLDTFPLENISYQRVYIPHLPYNTLVRELIMKVETYDELKKRSSGNDRKSLCAMDW